MKKTVVLICALLISYSMATASGNRYRYDGDDDEIHYSGHGYHLEDVDIDFEDGTIILESDRRSRNRDIVEITDSHELFINGDRIDLDSDQQALVKEYHEKMFELVDYAKEIGIEGAKIGAEGAKIGLSALGGLFKMAFTEYDSDDYERDIERKAERLEDRAEDLEEKAEEIEDLAEDIDDIFEEMCEEIPELDDLDWY